MPKLKPMRISIGGGVCTQFYAQNAEKSAKTQYFANVALNPANAAIKQKNR